MEEAQEILEIIFTIVNSTVFAVFLIFTVRLLRRNNQKLDIYMTTTLTCVGISILLIIVGVSYDRISEEDTPNIFVREVGQLTEDVEKIGIFVDIARLTILVITLKTDDMDADKKIKQCKLVLWLWLCFFMSVVVLKFLSILNNESTDAVWWIALYSYGFNLVVLASYLTLYLKFRQLYNRVKSLYSDKLSASEIN